MYSLSVGGADASQNGFGLVMPTKLVGRLVMLTFYKLSKELNPRVRGWYNYYGKFYPSALSGIGKVIDFQLGKWVRWKYPKTCAYHGQATSWLAPLRSKRAYLFAHWVR